MEITSRGDLTTGQTPPAARAAKHPDHIDATPRSTGRVRVRRRRNDAPGAALSDVLAVARCGQEELVRSAGRLELVEKPPGASAAGSSRLDPVAQRPVRRNHGDTTPVLDGDLTVHLVNDRVVA